MTFDVKSHALSTAFLSDYRDDELRVDRKTAENELAQEIQRTIEDWLGDNTTPCNVVQPRPMCREES